MKELNMKNKIIGSICLTLAIIIIVTIGTTFSYFNASSNENNIIGGKTYDFDVSLNLDKIQESTDLIPLDDSLIKTTISKSSDKCIDNRGYQVCSLYKITLINNGEPCFLNGYIRTNNTTYTTDNLKYQIFDTSYNNITDVMSLSNNNNEKVYFKNGNSLVSAGINNTNIEYYLVIWVHETTSLQNEDASKDYTGSVGFESTNGDNIEAIFSV